MSTAAIAMATRAILVVLSIAPVILLGTPVVVSIVPTTTATYLATVRSHSITVAIAVPARVFHHERVGVVHSLRAIAAITICAVSVAIVIVSVLLARATIVFFVTKKEKITYFTFPSTACKTQLLLTSFCTFAASRAMANGTSSGGRISSCPRTTPSPASASDGASSSTSFWYRRRLRRHSCRWNSAASEATANVTASGKRGCANATGTCAFWSASATVMCGSGTGSRAIATATPSGTTSAISSGLISTAI